MERTITVFHEGAMAHYNISRGDYGRFKARLLTYNGNIRNAPPQELQLQKDGNRWTHDDNVNRDLADEIGYVIELQKDMFKQPIFTTSERYQDNQGR